MENKLRIHHKNQYVNGREIQLRLTFKRRSADSLI
jgi:hypothetical protein